jgi:AcrR family transcriptional regulator
LYHSETGLSSTLCSADGREHPIRLPREIRPRAHSRDLLRAVLAPWYSRRRVDELIARAGVAKASFYRHFPSKEDLIVAFLERREQRWTNGWVEKEARQRASSSEKQLLAIFDAFDEWFRREDFEACSFINVLLELGPHHPAGSASVQHLQNIRSIVRGLAEEAGLREPGSFADSWHILMKGSIIAAAEGDVEAAQRARSMARLLIAEYR